MTDNYNFFQFSQIFFKKFTLPYSFEIHTLQNHRPITSITLLFNTDIKLEISSQFMV